MTSRTGKRPTSPDRTAASPLEGFTLIELIVVMALLLIVMGYAAPSLSRFFRGRHLDSEARRFLAVTRYGQSRAVSEGVPMVLWIDAQQGTYGLQAQTGYVEQDDQALQYTVDPDVQIELPPSALMIQTNFWTPAAPLRSGQRVICFLPDGYLSETSLDRVLLRHTKENETICIGASANRTRYEIQTNQLQQARP